MDSSGLLRNVERAAQELCQGGKVRILSGDKSIIVSSCEFNVDVGSIVAITSTRAEFITGKVFSGAVTVKNLRQLPVSVEKLTGIALEDINEKDTRKILELLVAENKPLSVAALKLAKIAELIPAVVIDSSAVKESVSVNVSEIECYEEVLAENLQPFCTAPLTLENAHNSKITVFKARGSTKEHYTVAIGSPQKRTAPLVRIHSCCFTGDILASLRCDCKGQLEEALKAMSKDENGGILLYLMQEGRGIGLVNKLRTYSLQERGFDTVEANKFMGFEDDERPFLPGAKILNKLGFTRVKLLTNNPRKVKGLEDQGIRVVERVEHLIASNQHNESYMNTKFRKLGHLK